MIPFLEHDDANRALMGSNMQRQAVPLLAGGAVRRHRHGAPCARDSGDVIVADIDGVAMRCRRSSSQDRDGAVRTAPKQVPAALQPGHEHQPAPDRRRGSASRGDVPPTVPRHRKGEMALGKNLLVAFMPWEGYNYE